MIKPELEFLQELKVILSDQSMGWMLRLSHISGKVRDRIHELTSEEEE